MHKGSIGVTTENIFPIIKKFLYSDHEIFLRELVSNAVDATQKLKAISGSGEFKQEIGDITIRISLDEKNSTLTISDRGIGMTQDEVEKYINQIAFSSAGEFLDKYKDQLNSIIGHFGLGFYSSFMVAKKVEIHTLSWKEGATAVKWSCEGDPNYVISEGDRKERGTDIILYIDEESKEFLQETKILQLLNKYCKFLPVPVAFGKEKDWKDGKEVETEKDRIINSSVPIWTKKPSDLKEEDYQEFYKTLYPMQEDPLFHIHLNVDYPFNLTGVLYFPKIKDKIEVSRNKIQLYCNQVFVTDSVENIVPDFLTLLHGVIDSPDIPLNVSRSYLQSDSNVKKISNHITKKVADRLEEIYKNDRAKFEEKWDNLKLFIEYGMITEERFYERAHNFALFKNVDNKYFSYQEYKSLIESNQTNKDNKIVYLYTTDKESQYSFIETAKSRGYDVLIFDSQLDAHFINHLESKFENVVFSRVDSDYIDNLIKKDEVEKPNLSEDQKEELSTLFKTVLPSESNFDIDLQNLSENDNAVIITQHEFMRRYRDMSALGGGMNFYGSLPESYNVIVNNNHPLVKEILEQKEDLISKEAINTEDNKEKKKEIVANFAKSNSLLKQIVDLALLSNGLLKGEELNKFIKRSFDLIKK